jgi:hypothetical protein
MNKSNNKHCINCKNWEIVALLTGMKTVFILPYKGKKKFSDGDELVVRETWMYYPADMAAREHYVQYKADNKRKHFGGGYASSPGIHIDFCSEFSDYDNGFYGTWHSAAMMPSIASRIVCKIQEARLVPLHDIGKYDALNNGNWFAMGHPDGWGLIEGPDGDMFDHKTFACQCKDAMQEMWDARYGTGSWEKNPVVWALTVFPEIDAALEDAPNKEIEENCELYFS